MFRSFFFWLQQLIPRSTTGSRRDLSYLKSKPYDQLTAAELTAAKEAAKTLVVPRLVACADPGNMPLSNDKLEGFQNKIAAAVGRKMGTDISFFWRPYLERGLTRDTFDNNECQVLIDMPTDYSSILDHHADLPLRLCPRLPQRQGARDQGPR